MRASLALLLVLSTGRGSEGAAAVPGRQEGMYRTLGGGDVSLLGLGLPGNPLQVQTVSQCAVACQFNLQCFSFNVQQELPAGGAPFDDLACELNIDTVNGSGKALSTRSGYLHYEKLNTQDYSGVEVSAAAHDPVNSRLYLAFAGVLYMFVGVSAGSGGSTAAAYPLPPPLSSVCGLLFDGVPDSDTTAFTFFLCSGTMVFANLTSSTAAFTWDAGSARPLSDEFGELAPPGVNDVVRINGTLYLFYGGDVYTGSDGGNMTTSFPLRTQTPHNPFAAAPYEASAVSELDYPEMFFFKGGRLLRYDVKARIVVGGGVVIQAP